MRDCPKKKGSTSGVFESAQKLVTTAGNKKDQQHQQERTFALVPRNPKTAEDVISSTLLICGCPAHVLFDSGSTHSFVAPHFAKTLKPKPEPLGFAPSVVIPTGSFMLSDSMFRSCDILISDKTLHIDLILLQISSFDVILGMDWLAANDAAIDCKKKKISLCSPDFREIVYYGTSVSTPPYLISSL